MPKKKLIAEAEFPKKVKDVPATQGMLQLVRTELKADIRGLRSEMHAGFNQMDSRFKQLDSKFAGIDSQFKLIDSKFSRIDSKFDEVNSKLEKVIAGVARTETAVEEQNSKNNVVLEGLSNLYHRQDRVDRRTDDIENVIHGLAARLRR